MFAADANCLIADAETASLPCVRLVYGLPEGKAEQLAPIQGATPALTVVIADSGYFGRDFLQSPVPPESPFAMLRAASQSTFETFLDWPEPASAVLRFDFFAAAFWFLSRVEEYADRRRDRHGRFLCEFSAAPPECYDQPLVNRWFERLDGAVRGRLGLAPRPVGGLATIALTHDVDLLRKHSGWRGVRRALAAMRGPLAGAANLRQALPVWTGARRDPYDSFDALFGIKERLGAQSTWFFMAADPAAAYGPDYELGDGPARQLIARANSARDEVGIHLSYGANQSSDAMRGEANKLAEASGRHIHGARQHYLRIDTPSTWHAQAQAGIEYDATLAFADRAGFRCGWSGPMRPFDARTMRDIPVVEIPTVAMDMTLSVYEAIPAEQSVERLAALLDASATLSGHGACVLLWHNTLRDHLAHGGYWGAVEYFLAAAGSGAHFVTLRALAREFCIREKAATGLQTV